MRLALVGFLTTAMVPGVAVAQFPIEGPTLDPFFASHMVLPRAVAVPITGRTSPGARVDVSFGTARVTGTADEQGRFRILLAPQEVRDHAETLFVRSGQGTTRCDDVLVGDVYFCTGQSNMAFELRSSIGGPEELGSELPDDVRVLSWVPRLTTGSARYTLEDIEAQSAETFYVRSDWSRATPESLARFSAVAWHFGRRVAEQTGIPVGLVVTAVGGSPIEAWLPLDHLAANPDTRALVDGWLDADGYPPWCQERARQNLAAWIESGAARPAHHAFEPGLLFEAGVEPFLDVPFRAVLWYQGESNATRADPAGIPTDPVVQANRMRDLLATWRRRFALPRLPFLMVQLPGYRRAWVEFRDAQAQVAAADPDVHLAITLDVGHPTDVHPQDKAPVGDRLARIALRRLHGQRDVGDGPRIAHVEFDAESARVVIENAKAMQSADGLPIRGFALAGEDLWFHPAAAVVTAGNEVRVTAPAVGRPTALRYAWQDDPRTNFVDGGEREPAPHRTDAGPLRPRLRVANLAGLDERDLEDLLGPDFKVGTFSGPRGPQVCGLWEPDLAVIRATDAWDKELPAVRWRGQEADADLATLVAAVRATVARDLTRRR
ncbi:MAG: sialate O-acetylesterase [Planctomycetota bacterium]